MDRKTILAHGIGTVFAHENRHFGWHSPVALLDTRIWHRTGHANGPQIEPTTRTKTDATAGYPVLRIMTPGSMTEERRAGLTRELHTIAYELTMDDIVNPDGTYNWNALPADITLEIVASREITGTWADYEIKAKAEAAAYEARLAEDRALYAELDAARARRREKINNAKTATAIQRRTLAENLMRLSIAPEVMAEIRRSIAAELMELHDQSGRANQPGLYKAATHLNPELAYGDTATKD